MPGLPGKTYTLAPVPADPKDKDAVYVLNTGFYRSTDAGKTYRPIRVPHGDNHDLWINPDNSNNFVISNDGGAAITFDKGKSWSAQSTMPRKVARMAARFSSAGISCSSL